jgi:hypothetical protein
MTIVWVKNAMASSAIAPTTFSLKHALTMVLYTLDFMNPTAGEE